VKEKDIWITPEELQHMLRGSLQWSDVQSHVNTTKTGMRKLGETNLEKQSTSKQTVPRGVERTKEKRKENDSKRLEGQPVIWLLGSVGLLTLSSWLYFVLFSK